MSLLNDIRVLDLSRILAGPWASQLLADYGAEVIKIEKPGEGDDTRRWGPPYLKNAQGDDTTESAYYLAANRGKHSVTIDFTQAAGQALIRELVSISDVLIENYKVGGLSQYGLDYASLSALNPRLIYCSITGFGQTGPYAQQAGYDAMIQAMGGLMSITGDNSGQPQKVGVAVVDLMAGMYASNAILAALHQRQRTGIGQHLDVALLDTQVAWLANQALNYLVSDEIPQRQGTAHPNIVPYQAMPAADGYFMLAIGNDRQFQQFCGLAECTSLAEDPRFMTNAARVQHREALIALLQIQTRKKNVAEWLMLLQNHHVPAGPINNLQQVFADPQVQHRGLQQSLAHIHGTVPQVLQPVKFSAANAQSQKAPPTLGEDTDGVLRRLLAKKNETLLELHQQGVL
ncbi:MAG: CoA transferase [Gammaproteobacteria bacterium]|nr:CoA transferase [Gammaproteobacteria bacterium]